VLSVVGLFYVVGAKLAVVPLPDGSHRGLYSLESPESWFEDFGRASLSDGKAHVDIDPDFGAVADVQGGCHVFLTAEGECNGLYVSGMTGSGFDVAEQQGGSSAVDFSYRVVARRKDIDGRRFPVIDLGQATVAAAQQEQRFGPEGVFTEGGGEEQTVEAEDEELLARPAGWPEDLEWPPKSS
jgi:hypothetical protein